LQAAMREVKSPTFSSIRAPISSTAGAVLRSA
jgi:hypothetical protein